MATTDDTLALETRSKTGTTSAHALRREGKVPAVLFGHGAEPTPVSVDAKALDLLLHTGARAHLITVTIDGGKRDTVLLRELQRDPVTRKIVHADLQRVGATETITSSVPIVTVGTADGVKNSGGVMDVVAHALEISGPANALPPQIDVDVTPLGIHGHITAGDVTLPPNFTLVTDPATLVISIEPSRVEQDVAAAETAPEAAAAPAAETPAEGAE